MRTSARCFTMADHPFDERVSGKNPFPCFLESMRLPADGQSIDSHASGASGSDSSSDSDSDGRCNCLARCDCEPPAVQKPLTSLNWSIDGLATLLPIEFSPLPGQRTATATATAAFHSRARASSLGSDTATSDSIFHTDALQFTPQGSRSATFFEDERQFSVLRTPQAVIDAQEQASLQLTQQTEMAAPSVSSSQAEYTRWRAADGMWLRELHRRCVETMHFYETRVRERQHKLARLQLPPSKLKLRRTEHGPSDTSGSSSNTTPLKHKTRALPREPLTPVVATRLSFGSIDVSPIPVDSAEKLRRQTMQTHTSAILLTPTHRAHPQDQSPSLTITTPPGLISTSQFSPHQFSPPDEEETKSDDKENDDTQASPASAPRDFVSSVKTVSLERDGASTVSSSPFSPPPDSSATETSGDAYMRQAKSITQRQLSFVAAIEEEANSRDDSESEQADPPRRWTTSSTPQPRRTSPPPPTSMASIYSEARALGITEPTAQWEYVQLIAKHTVPSSRQQR